VSPEPWRNKSDVSTTNPTQERLSGTERERLLSDLFARSPVPLKDIPLLAVKTFLADCRSWRNKYVRGLYMCGDFANEVWNAATQRKIRCGYVIVSFTAIDVGHALIAFETDYGIQYFEPQTGEEERITVGGAYPTALQGLPQNAIVSDVRIIWNDQ
jgi:hypothetical protein